MHEEHQIGTSEQKALIELLKRPWQSGGGTVQRVEQLLRRRVRRARRHCDCWLEVPLHKRTSIIKLLIEAACRLAVAATGHCAAAKLWHRDASSLHKGAVSETTAMHLQ